MKVTARARSREDRAGDPLDGLVNLFEIGIILSVAFLLAALSSMDLTEVLTDPDKAEADRVPADTVLVDPDATVEQIEVPAGQEVVGRGEQIGQVYRLEDGRTVIVKPPGGEDDESGTNPPATPGPDTATPPPAGQP